MEGYAAPACHLVFEDKVDGDVIMHDVHVPGHGVTMFTYYCVMQWNAGQNGGGYCGIQEHPQGRNYIFSIWEPKTSDEPINLVTKHPGTTTRRFTHEGKGMNSKNFDLGWKPDQWHTLVVRRWNCKGHTYFGCWVRIHDEDRWEHLITMDFPVPDVYFRSKTTSFIEDWKRTGENSRRVHFRNGYKRKLDNSWVPFVSARFRVNQSDRCALYNDNYDGGRHEDGFYMQTGHGTTPCPELIEDRNVTVPTAAQSKPDNPPIIFTIPEVTSNNITWFVPKSSTPQFAYSILVDGKEVASDINHVIRSYDVTGLVALEVEIVLEDILGRRTSKKVSLNPSKRDSKLKSETSERVTPEEKTVEGYAAPACHLVFEDKVDGDVIMHDVHVPGHGVTMFTYYCVMQWNAGQNGGGYCGIQEHPQGRNYIFSIWEPKTSDEPINLVTKHPGTTTRRFTHEGKGMNSKNFDLGWKPDQWHTLVVRRWNCKGHTYFGCWVRIHDEDRWEHLITMDFPVPDVYFRSKTTSFIEDWKRTGENSRRVHFRNGYKRKLDNSWVPFVSARFRVNQSDRCALYNDNYDGGRHEDGFYMQTGHGTTPCPELIEDRNVTVPTAAQSRPDNPPIVFTVPEVTSDNITWFVPKSSTPQFAYSVLAEGKEVVSDIDHVIRSYDVTGIDASEVEIVLEDILGRKTAKKVSLKPPNTDRQCKCQC